MEDLYKKAKQYHIDKNKEGLEDIRKTLSKMKISPDKFFNDVFKDYPNYNNPEFNNIIFNKKEFHRNKYTISKKPFEQQAKERCSTSVFRLTSSQKFLKNFISPLTPYNSVLLFHSVGVGKGCSAVSIAESFIGKYKKKVLVILSPTLVDNFKQQICDVGKVGIVNGMYNDTSNQCTGMTYPDLIPDRHNLNKEALAFKIKRIINERYQFKGFLQIANDYEKLLKSIEETEKNPAKVSKKFDEKLKDIYSDRVIIIDEVHNLRLDSESSKKKVPPKLMHILRVAQNVKLVLLTATPMFNNVTEIVWLINMMLTNDKRPTINTRDIFSDGVLTADGKKILIQASRGYISYMRGENPYTFPTRLLPTINNDKHVFLAQDKPKYDIFGIEISKTNTLENLQLIKSEMSTYQQNIYSKFEKIIEKEAMELMENADNVEDHDINEFEHNDTDIQMGLQISNIVLPTLRDEDNIKYYYGNVKRFEAFERCFQMVGGKTTKYKYDPQIQDKFGEFLSPDNIGNYAPKLKTIIEYIKRSEGIVYVYSSFLISGILPLAIALEHIGFSKYNSDNLLKTKTSTPMFKINGKPANYVILTADKGISPNNKSDIAAVKNPNNKNGEQIKVILGSNVATEGIDFKNIREIHILEPWYHLNKIEQIIGRAVRNCSHIDLPLGLRNTTIYKHVNINMKTPKKETIDVRVYRIADQKQYKIKKVENLLRKNAVDCMLNQNVLYYDPEKINKTITLTTSQGQVVKNFQLGDEHIPKAKCYPKTVTDRKIDSSTFDIYFLDSDIEIYISYIVPLFKQKLLYTYDEIVTILSKQIEDIETDIIKYALERMLKFKRRVLGPTNTLGYLIYKSNKYIFQNADKADMRMTVEERQHDANELYGLRNRKLDIKYFSPAKDKISESIDTSVIYNKISSKVTELNGFVKPSYQNVVYDFIIDRLDQREIITLVTDFFNKQFEVSSDIERLVLESIKRSGVFLLNDLSQTPKYFVNFYDKEKPYYMYKDDGKGKKLFMQCPTIEINNIETLEKNLQTDILQRLKDIKGFISPEVIQHRFKMVIKNTEGKIGASSGSVCIQNSKLLVDDLKQIIVDVDSSFNIPKATKGTLCDVYELVLRYSLPNKFARPYEYFLKTTTKYSKPEEKEKVGKKPKRVKK
jgi:hypothetical protein